MEPGLTDTDTDGDELPNRIDTDSDNDGLSDLIESGGVDADSDGLVDDFVDANGDGFDDALSGIAPELPDSDGDGVSDPLDADGTVVDPTADPVDDAPVDDQPADDDVGEIITGVDGNGVGIGCVITSNSGGADPSLPLLFLVALSGLFYSRKVHGKR